MAYKYQQIPLYGDKTFAPIELFFEQYENDAHAYADAKPLWLGLERENGLTVVMKLKVMSKDERTYAYVERTVKSLLWLKGGFRLYVAGNAEICERLSRDYSENGARSFDAGMMKRAYGEKFAVTCVTFEDFPEENEQAAEMGGKWEGCRIGFDAGGSDRKCAAVKDGEVLYSEEVVWYPKVNENPEYHYSGILEAFKKAASYMPKVDSIGVSSAGIYVANRTRVASLFIKVPPDAFKERVEDIYINAAKAVGCEKLSVVNDGDVAALAGAYETGEGRLLGIAMGTSEAGGYVNAENRVMGWLNELAFAPVDIAAGAALDEWSGDTGCGVKYFSQDAVIRLAEAIGVSFTADMPPGERLKNVQKMLLEDTEKIGPIFETIGVYLAYAVKYYARFYDLKNVMLMGRVMSGKGGEILLASAKRTLGKAFPNLGVTLVLPDEKNRRLGQAVTAASL